jgi:Amt family ammonium transporter
MAVNWKAKSTIDDTLDVFPCHGLGGMVGMFLPVYLLVSWIDLWNY